METVYKMSSKYGLKLFGDLQCSTQVGSIKKYKKFSLLCPNEKEARIALNDNISGLENLCRNLIKKTGVKNLIIKLASKGFILYQITERNEVISQPFPALSAQPVDTAGAGDSLLAIMACGISSGVSIIKTAALSCFITCISVERMGNLPITSNDVLREIELLKSKF